MHPRFHSPGLKARAGDLAIAPLPIHTFTLGSEKENRNQRAKQFGSSQCRASLSAIDSKSLRLVLDIASKDLISLLTGLPRLI